MPGYNGGADRRREQHRHPLSLALVPGTDQPLRVLEDLSLGRAAGGGLRVRFGLTLILHLAAVEAQGGDGL